MDNGPLLYLINTRPDWPLLLTETGTLFWIWRKHIMMQQIGFCITSKVAEPNDYFSLLSQTSNFCHHSLRPGGMSWIQKVCNWFLHLSGSSLMYWISGSQKSRLHYLELHRSWTSCLADISCEIQLLWLLADLEHLVPLSVSFIVVINLQFKFS